MDIEYVPAKTIVTKNKNTAWFGTDYNMNIYRGCCHGCIYCDSRSECYRIDDFDTVKAKKNALEIIRNDLKSKNSTGVVGTGAMSDPYNPYENELKLTRNALELINAYGFGIAIATKSDLITRDIDILQDIKKVSPVLAKITVTTSDDEIASKVEPNAPRPSKRFSAIEKLSSSGIYTGILMMPVLPFIEDNPENIAEIIHMAKESGAKFIYPAFGVTLRTNQRDWYYEKLSESFPGISQKYRSKYGNAYECRSPKAKELWEMFSHLCRENRILFGMSEIIRAYKADYTDLQLKLF